MWTRTNTREAMAAADLDRHTVTPTDAKELARLEERSRQLNEPLPQRERIRLRERTVKDLASGC